MNKVEQFQNSVHEHNEAAMASANTLAASFKTITTAHVEYAKKVMQEGSEFVSQLTKLSSPGEAIKLQNDYAYIRIRSVCYGIKKVNGTLWGSRQTDVQTF
jgi:hypothetical protein